MPRPLTEWGCHGLKSMRMWYPPSAAPDLATGLYFVRTVHFLTVVLLTNTPSNPPVTLVPF